MAKWTVRLDTPMLTHAGSNADVEARLLAWHDSDWCVLDNPGDDRERGCMDYYRVHFEGALGRLEGMELRVKKWDEDSPDWYLQVAYLADLPNLFLYELPFNDWIRPVSSAEWVHVRLPVKPLGRICPPNQFIHPPKEFLW